MHSHLSSDVTPLNTQPSRMVWFKRFFSGLLVWYLVIAFGLITLKGSFPGFGGGYWWWETGTVYIIWGFLNFLIFFVILHLIIPYGLKTRKYGMSIVLAFGLIIVIGLIKYCLVSLPRFDYVNTDYYINDDKSKPVFFTFWHYLRKTVITGMFVAVLSFGYGLTLNWLRGERFRKELENSNREADLALLRMQLNPHFLFNILNSIYALSLQKNDDAPIAVLKLSDMMRYMVYEEEDKEHKTLLTKEIDYIQNYIELHNIRYKHNANVNFTIEGTAGEKKIAPLLLIPLIENAFKHGCLDDPNEPVTIIIIIEEQKLLLNVKNKKNMDIKYYSSGIGLKNLKKRLMLLYPEKYELNIKNSGEIYETQLILYY